MIAHSTPEQAIEMQSNTDNTSYANTAPFTTTAPATRTRNPIRHFRIGVVHVSLSSVYRPAITDFAELYKGCETDDPSPQSVFIEVRRSTRRYGLLSGYEVFADGEKCFEAPTRDSVLPHIEWAINAHTARYMPRFFEIHAAGMMTTRGNGIIFPAAPGSGKSTLTIGLLHSGWRYLTDEIAMIDPVTKLCHPYPKAVCIKAGSYPVLDALGIQRNRRRDYAKATKGRVSLIPIHRFGPDATGTPCHIKYIVFPEYAPEQNPRLTRIARAEAVLKLTEQTFNFARFRGKGTRLLTDLVAGAKCFSLKAGEIRETCKLLEAMTQERQP